MSAMWFGEIDNQILVFDPTIQLSDDRRPHVFLWNASTKQMGQYIPKVVKESIVPITNPSLIADVFPKYEKWRTDNWLQWFEENRLYYIERHAKEEKARIEADEKRLREEAQAQEEALWAKILEERRKEAERWNALTPEQRHEETLAKKGLEYRGVRKATSGPRKTWCFSCKRDLDNTIDLECRVCNWIICRCGACGCTYQRIG